MDREVDLIFGPEFVGLGDIILAVLRTLDRSHHVNGVTARIHRADFVECRYNSGTHLDLFALLLLSNDLLIFGGVLSLQSLDLSLPFRLFLAFDRSGSGRDLQLERPRLRPVL